MAVSAAGKTQAHHPLDADDEYQMVLDAQGTTTPVKACDEMVAARPTSPQSLFTTPQPALPDLHSAGVSTTGALCDVRRIHPASFQVADASSLNATYDATRSHPASFIAPSQTAEQVFTAPTSKTASDAPRVKSVAMVALASYGAIAAAMVVGVLISSRDGSPSRPL